MVVLLISKRNASHVWTLMSTYSAKHILVSCESKRMILNTYEGIYASTCLVGLRYWHEVDMN